MRTLYNECASFKKNPHHVMPVLLHGKMGIEL